MICFSHSLPHWQGFSDVICSEAKMDTPQYINEVISDVRCIKPGWYAMDDAGNLSSGPFSSHAECFGSITQPAYGPLQNDPKQKDQCHDEHHDGT